MRSMFRRRERLILAVIGTTIVWTAGSAGPASAQTKTRINPKDGLTYVWIPPTTFRMGCDLESGGCLGQEVPRHSVTLTKGYWMGQTLVTHAAYKKVIGVNGASPGMTNYPWIRSTGTPQTPFAPEWGCDYPLRRSMSGPHAGVSPQIDMVRWIKSPGTAGTAAARRTRLLRNCQTRTGYTTCWEMSGSG